MLSRTEYRALRRRYAAYEAARGRICAHPCVVTPEEARRLPRPVGNWNTSRMEVYEFIHDPPERYFAYVRLDRRVITTWVGHILGRIVGAGAPFRSNMGDVRRHITAHGINGVSYHGTFYESTGDYCRLKARQSATLRAA